MLGANPKKDADPTEPAETRKDEEKKELEGKSTLGTVHVEERHVPISEDVRRHQEDVAMNNSVYSDHETIHHPNLDKDSSSETEKETYLLGKGDIVGGGFANSRFVRWFANFDEFKLRPFFIRNYSLQATHTVNHFNQLFTKNFDDKEPSDMIQLSFEHGGEGKPDRLQAHFTNPFRRFDLDPRVLSRSTRGRLEDAHNVRAFKRMHS